MWLHGEVQGRPREVVGRPGLYAGLSTMGYDHRSSRYTRPSTSPLHQYRTPCCQRDRRFWALGGVTVGRDLGMTDVGLGMTDTGMDGRMTDG